MTHSPALPASPPVRAAKGTSTDAPRGELRLGAHHFAHLRAVAEGIPVLDSARRYLGIEHGQQAQTAHRQVVDAVRAVARRRAENAWRLIGLTITAPASSAAAPPSLEDFIAQHDLDGWSEAEVQAMYREAAPVDHQAQRRQRRQRLRARQLDLLQRLQGVAAEQAQASDLISGWFDEVTATKLLAAGISTLQELKTRIERGGRWFYTLPSIGLTKARRIESHLRVLLGVDAFKRPTANFSLSTSSTPEPPQNIASETDLRGRVFVPSPPENALNVPKVGWADNFSEPGPPIEPPALLEAGNDAEAVTSWIAARAGSPATVKSYRREATRLLLWLHHERGGKQLAEMGVEDCRGYVEFLQCIPQRWISRTRAAPGEVGWAPFKGPLSHHSQRQAVTIVASLFAWLQSARYLNGNPWVLVNSRTGDDKQERLLDSKALSEEAMTQVMRYISDAPPSPARSRIRFIVQFVEAVGLRSSELLGARLGDFVHEPEGVVLQVHGKGTRNRIVVIPDQALFALQDYLYARGLPALKNAPINAPLLASITSTMEPIGYQALYEHVRGWLRRAVQASDLPLRERVLLQKASTHWLRHTFGTRAVAREVPLDVIQAQMGHASIQTTTSIYGRAPMARRMQELGKAFKHER